MQNFMFGGVTVLAVQLFNKNKRKKGKEEKTTKNLKKHISCTTVLCNIYLYLHMFCAVLEFAPSIESAAPSRNC